MRLSSGVLRSIGEATHTLGVIWGAAGLLKLVFGIRITFPIFPPVDLTRVAVLPTLSIAVVLVAAGAWFRRTAKAREAAEAPVSVRADEKVARLGPSPLPLETFAPRSRDPQASPRPRAG